KWNDYVDARISDGNLCRSHYRVFLCVDLAKIESIWNYESDWSEQSISWTSCCSASVHVICRQYRGRNFADIWNSGNFPRRHAFFARPDARYHLCLGFSGSVCDKFISVRPENHKN